ncbi:MAG TPA: cytochrome ubiquinol oxidase subunit I [Polyangiaceae bacterium]|nr:cytochrome ubiquinol oxidase subunit I [Polyangiaceae bacterium]
MIEDLLAARLQMAVSLGFHILFSVAGMAMPLLMVLAEWRHQRTGDAVYRELAQRWAKGTAILFAVGAISGTVLSFELGLLWPTFMEHAGPLIGMPFSLEGLAFFLESIALGIYLYGWDRVSPRVHLASGVVVAVSGAASGVLVIAVNAFMNTPQGFTRNAAGELTNVNLWEAFFTPAFPTQALHMLVAAYCSVGFAVLGIHAGCLWRRGHNRFHAAALKLTLPLLIVVTPLQALTGDLAAKHIAEHQPSKLAAAEALWETQRGAPLVIGGIPINGGRDVILGLHVPKILSVMAKSDFDAEVTGLEDIPEGERPPVLVTHLAFQVMVGAGFAMLALVAWAGWLWRKKHDLARHRLFLVLATLSGPLGLIAVEAGWCVTEVGRQPWIIRGVLLVSEAVTPMPGLVYSLLTSLTVYAFLGSVVAVLLYRHVVSVPIGASEGSAPPPATGFAALDKGTKVPAE